MIALDAWFWVMVVIFGVIGMLRGWTKEIITAAGLVLSLFALHWFGNIIVGPFTGGAVTDVSAIKTQFYVCSAIHLLFAFFSYQGPTLVRQVSSGKFGAKARGAIEESLLGFVVGAVNGYLIVGGLWAFLEYDIVGKKLLTYTETMGYPFEAMVRPEVGTAAFEMMANLPLPLLQGWLPFLVVVLFLFVIIAMI
jgi:hypothetical protein